jgi:hypothetical protein
MNLVLRILFFWTAADFIIGIPVWMLLKTRDRREKRLSTQATKVAAGPGIIERAPRYWSMARSSKITKI